VRPARRGVGRRRSETLRTELDRGEDRTTLRRLWEQARNHIDTRAGPDRRPELRRLRRLRSDLPTLANIVAGRDDGEKDTGPPTVSDVDIRNAGGRDSVQAADLSNAPSFSHTIVEVAPLPVT
jgi:hypothetical protein